MVENSVDSEDTGLTEIPLDKVAGIFTVGSIAIINVRNNIYYGSHLFP